MRAIVCTELGGPDRLQLQTLPARKPGATEVLLRVAAAGVNFPDTLIIQGKYQLRAEPPFIPGAEVAGEVLEVGAKVRHLKPGDRVAALVSVGGYASEAIAAADACLPIPADMPMDEAAGFALAYGTVIHALVQCGRLHHDDTLLVLGAAGGVGLAAVQLGKLMGARVIAAASTDDKLALAKAHGADETVNYSQVSLKEAVKGLTKGQGANVIFDPVGGPLAQDCLSAAAWGGRYLVVGFAEGTIPQLPANRLLLKEVAAVGVHWGAFVVREPARNLENFRQLFAWYEEGRFKPVISARYPLEQAARALQDMEARSVTGKVVLIP
ncbi:NADPH:quinone oxidoreductase family protein [Flagellatimonas centrodinii]|uniref:NADPH:quinone oxidoreductase family protein n=1 Tax=Flagellatimonas centrodinii TaxID=2806210 RepID=UPI001FEE8848|nr:NADPH:quinone oxidoreductase family protein [Flagellatimonas centrodinii]ULQ45314.1 NADPH:quinone oxidoreductase family protein [Flagellatimonas centrodinii]